MFVSDLMLLPTKSQVFTRFHVERGDHNNLPSWHQMVTNLINDYL